MENEKVINVALVQTHDQAILYVDGDLVSHDGLYDLPEYINKKIVRFQHRWHLDCDQNWEDNVGDFPESLDELYDNEHMWEEDHRNDDD